MANLACYPAMNIPNGLSEHGSPTNVTFFVRPFMEMEIICAREGLSGRRGPASEEADWARSSGAGDDVGARLSRNRTHATRSVRRVALGMEPDRGW